MSLVFRYLQGLHKRQNDITSHVTTKMYLVHSLVPLLHLYLLGPSAFELVNKRILATDLHGQTLSFFKFNPHGPKPNLQLYNLAVRNLLHFVVSVKRVVVVQRFRGVDFAVRSAEDAQWSKVNHEIAVIGFRDRGYVGVGDVRPWDVDVDHWVAVDIEFADEDVDDHVVEGIAGHVEYSFWQTHQSRLFGEAVGECCVGDWRCAGLGVVGDVTLLCGWGVEEIVLHAQIPFLVLCLRQGKILFDDGVDGVFVAKVERAHADAGHLLPVIVFAFEKVAEEVGKLVDGFADGPEVEPFLVRVPA